MKKLNTRDIKKAKGQKLQMLTCYDYQTARLYNELDVDMILVGDSLGNVILGFDSTIPVSVEMMKIFGAAVKRGAKDKFVIVDMPYGSYGTLAQGLKMGSEIFQETQCEAVKLEGAYETELKIIKRLTQMGTPVMGHIGLTPQSVHQLGGYYTHGKDQKSAHRLKEEAQKLQDAGCFSIVLECVESEIAHEITQSLTIPTIGIGSGPSTDGQVLVTNDLLGLGPDQAPKFVKPIANLFSEKKKLLEKYLKDQRA